MKPGALLTGTVEAKSDDGYLVTVEIGHEKWQGILYHVPIESKPAGMPFAQSQNEVPAPTRFEDISSAYRHFEAVMHEKLQPFYRNEVEVMKRKISLIWSSLSEAEKEVLVPSL